MTAYPIRIALDRDHPFREESALLQRLTDLAYWQEAALRHGHRPAGWTCRGDMLVTHCTQCRGVLVTDAAGSYDLLPFTRCPKAARRPMARRRRWWSR